MTSFNTDEQGTWNVDLRDGNAPEGMEKATYNRSLGEMVQDLNEFRADFDDRGVSYDIAAWALFEAVDAVLGVSPEASQISKLAAAITDFMNAQIAEGVIEAVTYDERSELTA